MNCPGTVVASALALVAWATVSACTGGDSPSRGERDAAADADTGPADAPADAPGDGSARDAAPLDARGDTTGDTDPREPSDASDAIDSFDDLDDPDATEATADTPHADAEVPDWSPECTPSAPDYRPNDEWSFGVTLASGVHEVCAAGVRVSVPPGGLTDGGDRIRIGQYMQPDGDYVAASAVVGVGLLPDGYERQWDIDRSTQWRVRLLPFDTPHPELRAVVRASRFGGSLPVRGSYPYAGSPGEPSLRSLPTCSTSQKGAG